MTFIWVGLQGGDGPSRPTGLSFYPGRGYIKTGVAEDFGSLALGSRLFGAAVRLTSAHPFTVRQHISRHHFSKVVTALHFRIRNNIIFDLTPSLLLEGKKHHHVFPGRSTFQVP
jgi:hypothetical protein